MTLAVLGIRTTSLFALAAIITHNQPRWVTLLHRPIDEVQLDTAYRIPLWIGNMCGTGHERIHWLHLHQQSHRSAS